MPSSVPLLKLLLEARNSRLPVVMASTSSTMSLDNQRHWKQKGLDVIEIRHDLADSALTVKDWCGMPRELPLLFTCRSEREGGKGTDSESDRIRNLCHAAGHFDAVDVELSMNKSGLTEVIGHARACSCMSVASFHDQEMTPNLSQLTRRLAEGIECGADVVKIATRTETPEALGTLLAFLTSHARDNLAVLGMGKYGSMSRMLFPSLGSLFTFAQMGESTADGQMPIEKTKTFATALYSALPSS